MPHIIQRVLALVVAFSVTGTMPTVRANHHEHEAHASQTSGMVKGEIRRIDTENRKLTIKHEAIPDADMVAMTMAFRVADSIAIDKLKTGDKIRFALGKVEGKWLVVAIETDTSP